MSRDDPDGTDHCRWAFVPHSWSCETLEPAQDACLGPRMSPNVTVTVELLLPTWLMVIVAGTNPEEWFGMVDMRDAELAGGAGTRHRLPVHQTHAGRTQ